MFARSSSGRARTTLAGEPRTSEPGGMTVPPVTSAPDRAVEDDRAHADEHLVLDGAGMEDGGVADGDQFTHVAAEVVGEVDDGVVLDIGARADNDLMDVAPQGDVIPDAYFFMQGDAPDHIRAGGDEHAFVNGWGKFEETLNGHAQELDQRHPKCKLALPSQGLFREPARSACGRCTAGPCRSRAQHRPAEGGKFSKLCKLHLHLYKLRLK